MTGITNTVSSAMAALHQSAAQWAPVLGVRYVPVTAGPGVEITAPDRDALDRLVDNWLTEVGEHFGNRVWGTWTTRSGSRTWRVVIRVVTP